ncbi:MAG: hypothetical protein J1E39_08990 [Eubacterium sp.]|nr:hypothetical protein [Eubacterium sp.]
MKLYKRIAAGALSVVFAGSLVSLPAAAASTPIKWDGSSGFVNGYTYYISDSVTVDGSYTLPASSSIVLNAGADIIIPAGSSLNINGSVSVQRGAQLLAAGSLTAAAGSDITVKGELLTGANSKLNVSGDVLFDRGSYISLLGNTEIAKGGQLYSYAAVTVDGSLTNSGNAEFDGMLKLYADTTINSGGYMYCGGTFSIENGATMTNSGELLLGEDAYYKLGGAFSNTGGGYVTDNRKRYEGDAYSADNISLYTTNAIKGIDVSYYQDKYIDWNKVKASGIKFAMVRSSYGYIDEDSPSTADKYFHQNVTGAIKAGLDVGVYHYCYAETVEGARDEARFVLSLIKGYDINYPIVIDIEDDWYVRNGYTKAELTAITEAFCDEIKDAGYLPMVYSYANWLSNQMNMSDLNDYAVWVAHVGVSQPSYSGRYFMWQYSWEQTVNGIADKDGKLLDVDGDYSYVDFAKYIKDNHLNNL